jgi:predicted O-methyltransferase YrrM
MDDPFPSGLLPSIEKFFESEETREPGENLYPDIFLTELFFPLQRQRELARMMEIAREYEPKVVYEIGADKGGGLYHFCKSLPTVTRVIACEVRGTPYQHLFEKAFPHIDFLWLAESSYGVEAVSRIKEWLGSDTLDVVFIDGDKSAFELDFDTVQPMLSKVSVVFMHDVTDPAPGAAFNAVVQRKVGHCSTIIDRTDATEACQRENEGIPSTGSHEGWLRHWKGRSYGVGVIRIDR